MSVAIRFGPGFGHSVVLLLLGCVCVYVESILGTCIMTSNHILDQIPGGPNNGTSLSFNEMKHRFKHKFSCQVQG